MPDSIEIVTHYLERYRKTVSLANKILGITLLILLVNWAFVLERQYSGLRSSQTGLKRMIKDSVKLIGKENERWVSLDVKYYKNYGADTPNLQEINRLEGAFPSLHTDDVENVNDDTVRRYNSLKTQEDLFDRRNTAYMQLQATIHAKDSLKDSLRKIEDYKATSVRDNLKDSEWSSLIKFVFIVAGNPHDGGLYLMGLVIFVLIAGFMFRLNALHYLAKTVRMCATEPKIPANTFRDFGVSAPFWLAPFPKYKRAKVCLDYPPRLGGVLPPVSSKDTVDGRVLGEAMDWNYVKAPMNFYAVTALGCLVLLQWRLLAISVGANKPIDFDLTFKVGFVLFLVAVGTVVIWLWPIKIDDHLNTEPPKNRIERRVFITMVATLVLGALAYRRIDSISPFFKKNEKRFIKRKRKAVTESLKPGFYRKRRTDYIRRGDKWRVYYVDRHGKTSYTKLVRTQAQYEQFAQNLEPTLEPDFNSRRFTKEVYNGQLEAYTLDLLARGRWSYAADLMLKHLIEGLDSNARYPVTIRLFDLGVKIIVRDRSTPSRLDFLLGEIGAALGNARNDDPIDVYDALLRKLSERMDRWPQKEWQKHQVFTDLVWNRTTYKV